MMKLPCIAKEMSCVIKTMEVAVTPKIVIVLQRRPLSQANPEMLREYLKRRAAPRHPDGLFMNKAGDSHAQRRMVQTSQERSIERTNIRKDVTATPCGPASRDSCRRPQCQMLSRERWIENRKHDLLNAICFHVVFTGPSGFRPVFYMKLIKKMFSAISSLVSFLVHLDFHRVKGGKG